MKNKIQKFGLALLFSGLSSCSTYSLHEKSNFNVVSKGDEEVGISTNLPFSVINGGDIIQAYDKTIPLEIQLIIPCVRKNDRTLGTYFLNGDFSVNKTLQNVYTDLIRDPESYEGLKYSESGNTLSLEPAKSLQSNIFGYSNGDITIKAPIGSCVGKGIEKTCIKLCRFQKTESVSHKYLNINGEDILRFIPEDSIFRKLYSKAREK